MQKCIMIMHHPQSVTPFATDLPGCRRSTGNQTCSQQNDVNGTELTKRFCVLTTYVLHGSELLPTPAHLLTPP